MTRRIDFDYDWAEKQQEQWETLASENMKSLDEWTETHLDWLDKHSTIRQRYFDDLLVWKSPFKSLTNTITTEEETNAKPKSKTLKTVIHISVFDEDSMIKDNHNNLDNNHNQHKGNVLVEGVEASRISIDQNMDDDQIVSSSQPEDNEIQKITSIPVTNKMAIGREEEESFHGITTRALMQAREELRKVENDNNDNTARKESTDNDNSVVPMNIQKSLSPDRQITHKEISAVAKDYVSFNRDAYAPKKITVNSPEETPELSIDIDSQCPTQSQPIKTPKPQYQEDTKDELQMVVSNYQEKISNERMRYEDDDDDEIQLVVSSRSTIKDQITQQKTPDEPTTPPKPSFPPSSSSTNTLPTPAPRYKSPFMSRLFKMRTRSLEEDSPAPVNFITARPKASMSASTISSEISNSRSMSLLDSKVGRKRSLVSIPEPIIVSEIEVSDSAPGAPYKKLKTVGLKQSKTPSVASTSHSKNILRPSSVTSKKSVDSAKAKEQVKKNEEEEEEQQDEPKYVVPSWAKSPELESLLRKQSRLDPEGIFGQSAPLQLKDIFAEHF